MNHETQITFARCHTGRILLHLITLRRDHQWAWHWRAICRELTGH